VKMKLGLLLMTLVLVVQTAHAQAICRTEPIPPWSTVKPPSGGNVFFFKDLRDPFIRALDVTTVLFLPESAAVAVLTMLSRSLYNSQMAKLEVLAYGPRAAWTSLYVFPCLRVKQKSGCM